MSSRLFSEYLDSILYLWWRYGIYGNVRSALCFVYCNLFSGVLICGSKLTSAYMNASWHTRCCYYITRLASKQYAIMCNYGICTFSVQSSFHPKLHNAPYEPSMLRRIPRCHFLRSSPYTLCNKLKTLGSFLQFHKKFDVSLLFAFIQTWWRQVKEPVIKMLITGLYVNVMALGLACIWGNVQR
jgi:hypothetical protein